MALLFFDGFDHYDAGTFTQKWDSKVGGTYTAAAGRLGTVGINNPSAFFTCVPASGATAIVGFAVKPTLSDAGNDTLSICDTIAGGSGIQVGLRTMTDGSISVRRAGSTEIARSAPGVVTAGVHYYIEIKVVIDNAVGTVEVRVNEIAVIVAAGLDTQVTSTARWNIIQFDNGDGIDDVYCCDGTGSAPHNDFFGDVHVDTLYPLTDAETAGAYAQFTPSTGTDHGALVDDATPAASDYNAAATAVLRETYRLDPPTVGVAVFGVQVLAYAAKTETEMVTCAPLVRADGTLYQGATQYPSVQTPGSPTLYDYLREIFPTDLGSGAQWSVATLQTLEAGLARLT